MRNGMNGRKIVMALAFAAIMAVSALAQSTVSGKVTFMVDGKIGTETVKKGTYKVNYTDAETGAIEINVGSKVLSIPFTKRQSDSQASTDRVTYTQLEDGSRSVATITLQGTNFTMVLDGTAATVAKKK